MFGRKGVKRVESIESEELPIAESEGFSLEELGTAYAKAIEQATGESTERSSTAAASNENLGVAIAVDTASEDLLEPPDATETDGVPVTPETILEAILFLGTSDNRPIPKEKILELFRGMDSAELEEVVDTLNDRYRVRDRAMMIARESGGYQMQLVPELHLVRDRFYGKVKETQLTQSAIDCLSLVAYQPGITREELESQWNQPAANMLSTLVRKGLLRIETEPLEAGDDERTGYHTTDRFLEIIGLDSLADLPSSEDL